MTIRSAVEGDWAALNRLHATSFSSFQPDETIAAVRSMMPADAVVVACDGEDVVGMAMYLDLELTVPGGARLPMAGITWVAVAPTHRRRGLLRHMFAELDTRIIAAGYPVAGLYASEGGIYGRFGYGPSTVEVHRSVERRFATFHAGVPDPGGVRIVAPSEARKHLAEIYERWRLATPGGLYSPSALWDDVLADHEVHRHGAGELMALLHPDGFVMYRNRRTSDTSRVAQVGKFCAATPEAHAALWRALVGLDLVHAVTVTTHPADPLPYLLTDARRASVTHTEDGLWLRPLDVPTMLQARVYLADLSVVLDVGGEKYALDVRDGRARCTPTDAQPDVTLDVAAVGSLYLGAHRATDLGAGYRAQCKDPLVLAALDRAFASDVPAQCGFDF